MNLVDIVEPGDLIFPSGDATISKLIKKATFSPVNHVALVYDKEKTFETDGAWGKAMFRNLSTYEGKKLAVARLLGVSSEQKEEIQRLCKKYENSPYSYWDVILNGMIFWLDEHFRNSIVDSLGTKKYMKCDELSARIIFEGTGYSAFKDFSSFTPGELYSIVRNWKDWEIVYSTL